MWMFRLMRDPDPTDQGGGTAVVEQPGQAPSTWVDSLPDNIRTSIPEEFTKDPNVTKYKDVNEFVKGHVNLSKMISAKGVIVPGPNATPEEREKYYNDLGRPPAPDGYKYSKVDGLHQSINISPEKVAGFNAFAHKIGLTNQQADETNKFQLQTINGWIVEQEKADLVAAQKAETALRQEWGAKFQDNTNMVFKGIMKAGGQETIDAMGGEKGLGSNPVVLKTLAKVFGLLSEDQLNTVSYQGAGQSSGGNETKEEAQAKITAMNSDTKGPLWDTNNAKHDEAVAERQRLYKIAYQEEVM